MEKVKIKAPATIANLVCGFDILGLCLMEPYDIMELRLLKEKKVPKISEMFQDAKHVGAFRLIACSAGLEYMGVESAAVEKNVDEVLGLPTILSLTADAETKLFI